ncbi:hypothetical protein [Chitinophaga nivalis]|uniref:Uncharacterized protein n=1 Tax=Chitinophaga nivalis TaxID=2991709 RepID=A0ABT3IMY4_9BACT|nr:hypothetical protein [Chitinophaga nivalis]MCW3464982.1 hypothetical protein [Chitinophaga nivalis]MCW3485326.1 hypothetical protein [Chitinophaga nivalis]
MKASIQLFALFSLGLMLSAFTHDSEQVTTANQNNKIMTSETISAPNDDDDLDGVINRWDKCPATPANTRVDSDGCPLKI